MPYEDDSILNPSKPRVADARRWVCCHGPWPLWRALELLDAVQPHSPLADSLWTVAETATRMNHLLAEAQGQSGRAVVETVMALHRAAGAVEGRGPGELPSEFVARCGGFFEAARADASPWRHILMGWIDVMGERLTMNRYADPVRRARHARTLMAEPLALVLDRSAALGGLLAETARAEINELADWTLAFSDLTRAGEDALRGWNRIELPEAERLGGFFGLADEARPPDVECIRTQAQRLLDGLSAWRGRPSDPRLGAWAGGVVEAMREALEHFLKAGSWPVPSPPSGPGLAGAFKRLFGKGGRC